MNTHISDISSAVQHHAQLLIGTREWALSCILPEYRHEGIDVIHHTYYRMTIDDVRALIHEALFRPVESVRRIFVIDIDGIFDEAQNALLKLFEEPNEYITFYLIVPRKQILFPTLQSRFHLLGVEGTVTPTGTFEEFRALAIQKRLDEIARRLKNEDMLWVRDIVAGAVGYARTSQNIHIMRIVQSVDMYIRTKGASKKMLLEHLALSL